MNYVLKSAGITLGLVVLALGLMAGAILGWAKWRQREFDGQEDTRDLQDRATEMAQTYLEKRPRAALVIGIHQQDRNWVGGFGAYRSADQTITPDGDTLYEIGSITKVFTGIAMASLAERNKLKLNDPIGKHLAEGFLAADGRGTITLLQLATHQSGLPRLPSNFWTIVGTNRANPYADFSTEDLFTDFKTVKLNSLPGERSSYSNYGSALLGQMLAVIAEQSYEALTDDTVLRPLDLKDTVFVVDEARERRRIGGFTPGGEPTSNWDFDGMAPAGALRSTANDMLKFIRANLHPEDTPIAGALELAMQRHSGSGDGMGLGWHVQQTVEGLQVWWHNGGTGGYASFLALDPGHQSGVIVLTNHGDALANRFDIDKIGMNLLRLAANISLH